MLDAFVSVEVLLRELHSFLVGVWEFTEGALSLAELSKTPAASKQSKRQQRHLQPVWARPPLHALKTTSFQEVWTVFVPLLGKSE